MELIDFETRRKSLHIVFGLSLALLVWHTPFLVSLLVIAWLLASAILTAELVDQGFKIPIISWLVEKAERKGKTAKGVIWYFSGTILILIVFGVILSSFYPADEPLLRRLIVGAMLIVATGDSTAAIVGSKIGSKRLPKTLTKSYEGTLAGFIVSFFAALTVLNPIQAFAGAFAGTVTEAYFTGIDDNLSIPVLSCCAIVLVTEIFYITAIVI